MIKIVNVILQLMDIRVADENDIKMLQDLNDEVIIDNSKYDPDLKRDSAQSETGRNYFSNTVENPDYICLIAEENNKAVGYIAASPKKFEYRMSKYIEIENMGVSPDYRAKGIGSQLIDECLKIAKERGFQKVYVNSYFDNDKAIKFYERNGFKKIDISLEKII